jgi:hypothetical protein
MKKIINGLRYDTDKAILVGEYYTSGRGKSDFSYWEASLYKTPRSGKFFLAGEGHAMTRFASHNGNTSSWGSGLIPMSKEEALEWAEQYLALEDIETHFSDSIEDA